MSLIEAGKVSAMETPNKYLWNEWMGECIASTAYSSLWRAATSPVPAPEGSCQLGVSRGVESVEELEGIRELENAFLCLSTLKLRKESVPFFFPTENCTFCYPR